jgi:hypothetical protein
MLEHQRTGRALPSRSTRTGGTGDLGRSQRTTRLAAVAGSGNRIDQTSAATLCRRGSGVGVGRDDLRAGLPRLYVAYRAVL